MTEELKRNPHDLIGIKGIIPAQNRELENKKVQLRMDNERYLREHPELGWMVSVFLRKVLYEKPEKILHFSGEFFDRNDLRDYVEYELGRLQEG
mmetsp:Transcript_20343/g.23045  ORF Transcript_20343/g.23045 Transcript_20343/m.23045 type:complete len:94 (+) Transcript_20343:74-355(+)|eukprot:CAMPEP_0115005862 /NCGR_PEP_ID=MMETSP0216-20121206/20138_1 /TAXON_ID=223996 /ORGANISM="Protocruzia adherens, Strain Boccale" /LENGTH=93 /DNA_ID=CAMNT_0002372297 /DNA_START=141 /DNA_END=422 /DNA_ORIENTATION=-